GLVSGLPDGRNHEPCDKAYCGPTRRISGGAGFSRPAYHGGAGLDSVPDLPEWLYRAALPLQGWDILRREWQGPHTEDEPAAPVRRPGPQAQRRRVWASPA